MKRALALGLVLLATAASSADLVLTTTRDGLRALDFASSSPKLQWAPSGNFSALHGRAVFSGETKAASRPYARERFETAAGFGIFLSRDSIGASSYLSSPNGMGPHSYANLSPGRYTDPDGRGAGEFYVGCVNGFGTDLGFDVYGKETVRSPAGSYFPFKEVPRWPSDPDEFSGFAYCRFFAFADRTKLDRAVADRESQLPAPLADRYQSTAHAWTYDTEVGTNTREWWYASKTRQQFIGGFFGSVAGATPTPLPTGMPGEAQESAEMMRFSVGWATAIVAIGRGASGVGNLRLPPQGTALALTGAGTTVGAGGASIAAASSTAAASTLLLARAASFSSGGSKKKCQRPTITLNKSKLTYEQQLEARALIKETNQALRKTPGTVGKQVPYKGQRSIKYIQEEFFPWKNQEDVNVGDIDNTFNLDKTNVDEIIPRFLGGQQIPSNQRIADALVNSMLGQAEEYATRGLANGTCIDGFDLKFK